MLHRWWLGGVAIGIIALVMCASVLRAKPGIVRTLDGNVFTGDVTEDGDFVTIKIHGIPTKVNRKNVSKIEYTATIDEQYATRHDKLAPDDVPGRVDLATWCSQNQRPDLAINALDEAMKIAPADRNIALQRDTAQKQWDLDRRRGDGGTVPGPIPPPAPGATPPASQPATNPGGGTVKPKPPEFRLLTNDEINIIRQKELQPGDTKVQVRFDNNVVKKYLATGDHDAAAFRQMPLLDQALEIIHSGDPNLIKDVRIVTDPSPLLEFKQKIHPLVALGCASTACHGGTKSGDFGLFTGDSPSTVYTNFYILQTYTKSVDGAVHHMMDRTAPERSLFIDYSLPLDQTGAPHPKAPNYRPRFRGRTDPAYSTVIEWLNSLKPIPPDYGIAVSAKVPTTQPAGK